MTNFTSMKKLGAFTQFGIGAKTYIEALSFVMNKGLWIYFMYPLILSLLLFFFGFNLVEGLTGWMESWIMDYIDTSDEDSWLRILTGVLHFFLSIALKIVFFLVYSTLIKYIVLIIMSPVMTILSEKTETILTGKQFPFSFSQLMRDILRGVLIALRNMFFQLGIVLLSLLVIWIPVIGWFCPILLWLISWYFYGFSMIDYVCERRKLNVSQSIQYIRTNKGLAIGNGLIFSLLFMLPIVGVILASVLAPVAGCIAVLESEKKSAELYAKN